jgi:hypothetical protein
VIDDSDSCPTPPFSPLLDNGSRASDNTYQNHYQTTTTYPLHSPEMRDSRRREGVQASRGGSVIVRVSSEGVTESESGTTGEENIHTKRAVGSWLFDKFKCPS